MKPVTTYIHKQKNLIKKRETRRIKKWKKINIK